MLCPCMLSDEYISSDLRARNDAKIDIYFGFMFQPTPNNTRETRTDLLSKPQNYYFFLREMTQPNFNYAGLFNRKINVDLY